MALTFKHLISSSALLLALALAPVVADVLVWLPVPSVADQTGWLGFFGNYFGGIIGGLVAWFVARYQIQKENQRKVIEERLTRLYAPAYAMLRDFQRRGAHRFLWLPEEERNRFLQCIAQNITYADAKLELIFTEMQWALGVKNNDITNRKYIEIQYQYIRDLIEKEFHSLREQLGLPNMKWSIEDVRSEFYNELEKKYFPEGYSEEEI